uniref:Uncharacterized protein n=1 Tax=Candidatus Kentrum sp. FW TaxID=2126338 RepID=A0A450S454_9GAMM|nr:MAG: hypothetical protein BECKFW1821A_GA0114235_10114 [Candidatus Kentron sp. FW]VFJ46533.1 MAG: hypothetical protein BECKFW1821B_GA0114236_10017 [Candidatus Kentron sp. FW]
MDVAEPTYIETVWSFVKEGVIPVALLGTLASAWFAYRRLAIQLQFSGFLKFTERYNDVVHKLDTLRSCDPSGSLGDLEEEDRKAVVDGMRVYMNLCSTGIPWMACWSFSIGGSGRGGGISGPSRFVTCWHLSIHCCSC